MKPGSNDIVFRPDDVASLKANPAFRHLRLWLEEEKELTAKAIIEFSAEERQAIADRGGYAKLEKVLHKINKTMEGQAQDTTRDK